MGQYRTLNISGIGLIINTADNTCVAISSTETSVGTTNDAIEVHEFETMAELQGYISDHNLTLQNPEFLEA